MAMRRPTALIGCVVTCLVATACNPFADDDAPPTTTSEPPTQVGASVDGTLRIGLLAPQSGELASFGPAMLAAADLAATDATSDELPVDLIPVDTESSRQTAASAAAGLVTGQQADALVGPATTDEAEAGVIDAALTAGRIVCLPTATAPRLLRLDDPGLVVAPVPNAAGQIEVIAAELVASGARRVAVLHEASGDATVLAELLQARLTTLSEGAAVADPLVPLDPGDLALVDEEIAAGDDEVLNPYADEVEQASAVAPDAVVVFALPAVGIMTLRALLVEGLGPDAVQVWVGDDLSSDQLADGLDPDQPAQLAGLRGVRPLGPSAPPPDFVQRLEAGLGGSVTPGVAAVAAAVYDCVALLALAGVAAGSDDPASISGEVVAVSRAGDPCTAIADCRSRLVAGDDVDFEGLTGVDLGDSGFAITGAFEPAVVDDAGRFVGQGGRAVEILGVGPPTTQSG